MSSKKLIIFGQTSFKSRLYFLFCHPSPASLDFLISNNKNKEVEKRLRKIKKKGKLLQMAFMALNFCVLSIFRYSSCSGNLLTLEIAAAEKVSLYFYIV